MPHKPFALLLLLVFQKTIAQDLRLFNVFVYEKSNREQLAFISLSDVYPLSEHPDSLATPDFQDVERETEEQYETLELNDTLRNRMLVSTKISNNDFIFIYSYSKDKLIKIPVKNLKAIACLNIYGADWPYTQYDYMIGFEIDKSLLKELDEYYANSLVYIGRKSPFVCGKMQNIVWQKTDIQSMPAVKPMVYDTAYAGILLPDVCWKYETKAQFFFLQDYKRINENYLSLQRLLVFDKKSNQLIWEKIYYSGESATIAEPQYQWTGQLFKNRKPVIFGFQWIAFGCPYISFIGENDSDLYLKCDNRH